MSYLVIAAHPDDEVLGCGGSIAKWSKKGHEVNVLIMAEGATSRDRYRDRDSRTQDLFNLATSAKQAAEILNVKSVELLDYPDNRMDSVDLLDVVKSVEERIEKLKPEVVLTHHSGDLNIDHHITHKAVITACRPQPGQTVKSIFSFEVPSSTEWQSNSIDQPFLPNWFEDITSSFSLKMKALETYRSEMRNWPHPRSIKAVEYLARWRGSSMGCEAAESFMLLRNIVK